MAVGEAVAIRIEDQLDVPDRGGGVAVFLDEQRNLSSNCFSATNRLRELLDDLFEQSEVSEQLDELRDRLEDRPGILGDDFDHLGGLAGADGEPGERSEVARNAPVQQCVGAELFGRITVEVRALQRHFAQALAVAVSVLGGDLDPGAEQLVEERVAGAGGELGAVADRVGIVGMVPLEAELATRSGTTLKSGKNHDSDSFF